VSERAPRTVGLNALFLEPDRVGGTETYVRQLVPELGRAAPGDTFVLYLAREAAATPWDLPGNVRVAAAPVSSVSRVQRLGWELTGLAVQARRDGVDLLHSLGTTTPLASPMPRMVTVHDLIFEHYPEAFPGIRTPVLRNLLPRMLRRATRVVTDSEATRRDVVGLYGVARDAVDVVHLGPGRPTIALYDDETWGLRAAASVEQPYVLSVATSQPHKNLLRLVEAFAQVRARSPEIRLVLVGGAGQAQAELAASASSAGVADAVTFTGWIDDRTLDAIYAGAEVFAYPSLCEGFGLPLLEAMERGVPVLSSRATSLPEVGGDAVEYVDATKVSELATGLQRLLGDPSRRAELVAAGLRQHARFTWRRCALETLASYDRALSRATRA
jgi:glycosyltransferase involved in cell wall biosynthesis